MPDGDRGVGLVEITGADIQSVAASIDRLSELGNQLEAFGIGFEVESIDRYVDPDRLLTDHERRLLVAAVEHGYYDTPRDCSLTELAEFRDVAKSKVSETLHRAEGTVIKHYVAELVDGEQAAPTLSTED